MPTAGGLLPFGLFAAFVSGLWAVFESWFLFHVCCYLPFYWNGTHKQFSFGSQDNGSIHHPIGSIGTFTLRDVFEPGYRTVSVFSLHSLIPELVLCIRG